jgi:hypothetical protein
MDLGYQQGKLMYIAGKEDAVEGDVGTLDRPVQAQDVGINPSTDSDPVLFSYVYTKDDGSKHLRQLLVKLDSFAGNPARFTVLVPSVGCCGGDEWVTRTVDVTLVKTVSGLTSNMSINPHALAQYENFLYLVDDQVQQIVMVKAKDLEIAADEAQIEVYAFDMSSYFGDYSNSGRGQAGIILEKNLYALYLDADADATAFAASYLYRLTIDDTTGALTYDTQTTVGINAQSIIPVNDGSAVQLLIPAVGGRQYENGTTNGVNSNISYVPAVGTWPAPAIGAPVKITGDTQSGTAVTYDIHAVAAAMRNGSSAIFILTQIYTTSQTTADGAPWRLYRISVSQFFALPAGATLSSASSGTNPALRMVDEGTVTSISRWGIAFGLYFWDLLLEQIPDATSDSGDRLWAALGTPILVTSGAFQNRIRDPAYGSPTSVVQNAFIMYGYLGGVNINMGAFDLLIETQNQATRNVSLKRTFLKAQAPKPSEEEIAAARAAEAKGGK